jgi:hypothetical protein
VSESSAVTKIYCKYCEAYPVSYLFRYVLARKMIWAAAMPISKRRLRSAHADRRPRIYQQQISPLK